MKRTKATLVGREAEKALRRAVAGVIERNRRLGIPVAVMQDGKAVLIPAEQAVASVRERQENYKTKTGKASK